MEQIWTVQLNGAGQDLAHTILGQQLISTWEKLHVNRNRQDESESGSDSDSENENNFYNPSSLSEGSIYNEETEAFYVIKRIKFASIGVNN